MLGSSHGKTETGEGGKKREAMHPMLLMMIVVLICAFFTYIIPAGQYERALSEETGEELIIPDSFGYIERTPVSILSFLMSLTLGLQEAADIIFFLIIIGGMFAIVNGTGALNVGIANILKRLKGREIFMIPILMICFGCGSAFCGNFEEFLIFVPLILACCITVGYDSLTAVGIIFIAATAGYAGSITNAFTEGTAQEIAGIPRFSGMGLRVVLFIALEFVSIGYVMWIAHMVKANPKFSGAYKYDEEYNKGKKIKLDNVAKLSRRQLYVLIVFIAGMAFAVFSMIKWQYYVDELSAIFFAVGILAGIVGGLKPAEICEYFVKGCRDMILPCLMIGLANATKVILNDANVMDSILHSLSGLLQKFPNSLMPVGMFIFHELFNVIVPSGSAQAVITMPLMTVLADKADMTRQTAVLAYQLGDAFTNILAPTGGEILAALAICRVPFGKWVRYLLPLFIIWWLLAFVVLLYAGSSGFGPI
ncbi:MAG: C4-dicarboxylate ABC transporter permease [Lachnospiraceae bacterium]|nr:C4-dicarboxylate ABC transporter permease [Lachnospiraceae bacterium]